MSRSNLKKQINNLRNTLFDKDKTEEKDIGLSQILKGWRKDDTCKY